MDQTTNRFYHSRRLFLKSAAAATGSFTLGLGMPQIAGAFDYLQRGDWEQYRQFEGGYRSVEMAGKPRWQLLKLGRNGHDIARADG